MYAANKSSRNSFVAVAVTMTSLAAVLTGCPLTLDDQMRCGVEWSGAQTKAGCEPIGNDEYLCNSGETGDTDF